MATYISSVPLHAARAYSRARASNTLATILLWAWVLTILQGALRKWVAPGLTILYLVQDFPLAIAYAYALRKGIYTRGILTAFCLVLIVLLSIQGLLQIVLINYPLFKALVGLHHYLFYLPILFIVPACFTERQQVRFVFWNLISTLPTAPLAYLQSVSGKGAWVNRTSGGADTGFNVPGTDLVRVTGTFNSSLPYSLWCSVMTALIVGEWIQSPEKRVLKKPWQLYGCTLATILCTMVSGSRSALMLSAFAFLGGVFAIFITRNTRVLTRFALALFLLPIGVGLGYAINPVIVSANIARFSNKQDQQGLGERFTGVLTDFLFVPDFSLLGKGIGLGIAAANFGKTDSMTTTLSEQEPTRIAQELGSITGVGIQFARYIGTIAIFFLSRRVLLLRRRASAYAMPLALAVMSQILTGDLGRLAPQVAPLMYFSTALILAVFEHRHEEQGNMPAPASQQLSQTR